MVTVSQSSQSALPDLDTLKAQAKRLRASLADDGLTLSHGQALERIAHQHGFRDWNTLHATLGNREPTFAPVLGGRISGHYLGHAFDAEIIGIQTVQPGDRFRITLRFDQAVDVVAFEGMNAFRKRVTATVGTDGKTRERTSNGVPQMVLAI